MEEFKIKDEYIELMKLLKASGLCDTGGQAKLLIGNDLVSIDGEIENRKRFKVRKGMVISYEGKEIKVV